MSNYKLTTDLIADCMALIPTNLDSINENQGTFPQTLAGLCESYKNVMLNNYV